MSAWGLAIREWRKEKETALFWSIFGIRDREPRVLGKEVVWQREGFKREKIRPLLYLIG